MPCAPALTESMLHQWQPMRLSLADITAGSPETAVSKDPTNRVRGGWMPCDDRLQIA